MQSCGSSPLLPHIYQHIATHSKPKCMRSYQKVPGRAALPLPVVLREGWGLAGQLEEWERQWPFSAAAGPSGTARFLWLSDSS